MTEKYQRFDNMDTSGIDVHEQQPQTPGYDHFVTDADDTAARPRRDPDDCFDIVPVDDADPDARAGPGWQNGSGKGKGEDGGADGIRDFQVLDDHGLEVPEGGVPLAQYKLRKVLDHLAFRGVTVLLVIVDLCLVIADLAINRMHLPLEVTSLIILTYFVVECGLRIFAHGPREFVRHWIEVVDAVVIVVSFVFAILPLALSHLGSNVTFLRLLVVGRLIRIILIIRLITEKKNIEKATRQVVSQNKRRYQKDGYDLDLCYITDRVIAMSFPSTGLMAFYRNPIKEVARFLDTKHTDHYRVFNLCSERMYDESLFHHRVNRYRIDDHNVPRLRELIHFGHTVRAWLSEHCRNVIAVHCKGGKGRTGTMICTWLVESGAFEEAKESLDYFGDRRTDWEAGTTFQGVETPSQSRYVGYYEKVKRLHGGELPAETTMKLTSMCIKSITSIGPGDGTDLTCRISSDSQVWTYSFKRQDRCKVTLDCDGLTVYLGDPPVLTGDIKVMFFSSAKNTPKGYDNCLFYFWFHTSFIEDFSLWLPRDELDNPHKKKTWDVFQHDFGIKLALESRS